MCVLRRTQPLDGLLLGQKSKHGYHRKSNLSDTGFCRLGNSPWETPEIALIYVVYNTDNIETRPCRLCALKASVHLIGQAVPPHSIDAERERIESSREGEGVWKAHAEKLEIVLSVHKALTPLLNFCLDLRRLMKLGS